MDGGVRLYLAGVITAIIAYFVLPDPAGSVIWAAIAFSMPVAIMVGVRRFGPERPPWYLLAAGLAFYAFGDVLWNVLGGGGALGPGDAAYAWATS